MFELSLLCPEENVDVLSESLEALDALSVCIEDADAQTPVEQALFGEPGMPPPKDGWMRSVVKALFSTEQEAEGALQTLLLQDFFASCKSLKIVHVADQDWVRLTQSQFAPVEITPEFWIVPTWHQAPATAQKIITLDPGLSFGTGTHPTTRMCLRWIAQYGVQGQRVLDYGCGSGILAIGAALYGAIDIDAVDIDEAAVQSTRDNAAANNVVLHAGLPDAAKGQYHIVLANILATPLKVLAPLLCAYVNQSQASADIKSGHLVLAGILDRQAEELKAAYAPYAQLHVADSEDGWILMTARL
jgi:ribosomal protein L11 methyltransferase